MTDKKIQEAYDIIQIKPEKSLELFDEILKKQSVNIEAINGKAISYMKLNKIREAEKLFDKSLDITPTTVALLNKGLLATKKRAYENALDYYNRVAKLNPRMKNIIYILKNEVFDHFDFDDDQVTLTQFSKEVNILIKKGLDYQKSGKIWDSLECYETVIEKDEKSLKYIDSLILEINNKIEDQFLLDLPVNDKSQISQMSISGLEKLLLETNHNEALTYFNKILKINPNDLNALNYKAIVLFNQNKYIESIKYFDKCLKVKKDCYYAIFNKSLVFLRIKDIEKASKCFNQLFNNKDSYDVVKKYNVEDVKILNQNN